MPAGVSRRIIGAALVTALLLAGLVTARLQPNHMADVAAALEAIRHLGRVGWMASFFIQTFVAASGILPASLVGIAAGAIYGPVLGFLLAAAAILVGATLAFLLSRSLFRPLIANLLERQAKLRNFDALIADEGWKFVCLMRVSPIMPFAATSYVLGLSSILFQDYLVGSLAALPALMGYVVIGTLADASLAAWHTGAGKIRLALLVLGAVATVVLASKIARIAIRAGLGLELDAMPTLANIRGSNISKTQ
ncbi:MAG: TVP38/TMEM64 family protein [Acetobacteraceae bacterium]|nr:TVP38/TMEM64 family protein [Acetobacteraceae bacterium]MBV8589836.1 TVP38/TMEM64 family protein [Acetobacteraceae bacterium]